MLLALRYKLGIIPLLFETLKLRLCVAKAKISRTLVVAVQISSSIASVCEIYFFELAF